MILLRTCDENGKVQFVTVKNDMFYLECKHCGRIFPIGSICEFMEELGNENFDSEVLDWCEDCLDEKYEREDRYLKMLAQAKEVDKRKNSLILKDDSIDD